MIYPFLIYWKKGVYVMSIINICINNVNREYYLEEGSSGIVLENIVKDIESE